MTKTKTSRTAPVRFDRGRFMADVEAAMKARQKLIPEVAEESGLSKPTVSELLRLSRGEGHRGLGLRAAVKLAHWAGLSLDAYVVPGGSDD